MLYCIKRSASLLYRNATCSLTDGPENTTDSSLYILLALPALLIAGHLLWFLSKKRQSPGFMQKVNIMHATLPEGMDSSSSDVFVDSYEYLPEGMDSSSSDVFVDSYEYLPEGMDSSSARPSTSDHQVFSQDRPQTPEQEPTPATDALETEPMVDYARPSTSAAVLSESNPSNSPTDAPAQNYPTGNKIS
ncbi:hypothetical protein R3I94_018428 [Phoxinus phoxinus]